MQTLDVTAIGTAMVDIPIELTEEAFSGLPLSGLQRGTANILNSEDHSTLLSHLSPPSELFTAGGSSANSAFLIGQLGGKVVNIGRVGDDQPGRFFISEFDRIGVRSVPARIPGGKTGSAIVLIDSAAERTLCIDVGVNRDFSPSDIDRASLHTSKWALVQGHLLRYGAKALEAIDLTLSEANAHGCRVALSLGAESIVRAFHGSFIHYVKKVDFVIGNEDEARQLTTVTSREEIFSRLSQLTPRFIVTLGPDGAMTRWDGQEYHCKGLDVAAIDSTGAGDAFAGAFLYGVSHGMRVPDAMERANRLAALVVTQCGARLQVSSRRVQELYNSPK